MSDDRLRDKPSDRFSEDVITVDFDEETEQLKKESMGEGHGEQGHDQVELYRSEDDTVSLFLFDEGAEIPSHSVEDGSVIVHVLEGELEFTAGGESRTLSSNQAMFMKPSVEHSVHANAPSRMLLTVLR